MRHSLWLLLALAACKNDQQISPRLDLSPSATISAPEEGASYTTEDAVEFVGTVGDGNGLSDLVSVEWSSDIDDLLATQDDAPWDGSGLTRFATTLSEGTHAITLTALDAAGLQAQATVSVTVETAAYLPVAEISVPAPFDTFWPGDDIQLIGAAGDPNQTPDTLVASWSWTPFEGGDTTVIANNNPSAVGTTTATWIGAPIGSHRVVLTITDTEGHTAEAEVVVKVEDPNEGDVDEDGFTAANDCDDDDPSVNPGMEERCDGKDNDCNTIIDDKDLDNDSHVDEGCLLYPGPMPADDCDDANGTVYPGAAEQADGLDNDCNTIIDDGLDVFDNDGDCYCSAYSCSGGSVNPSCVTVEPGDCDDTDPWLNLDDLDVDGASTCAGDCDDTDPYLNTTDADNDGYSTCQADCDDADPTMSPADADVDGASSCDGDCDDTDPSLNILDADNDTYTTCDGDCDDNDPSLSPLDADNDGASSCDGDCDDRNPSLNILDADNDTYTTCDGDCDDNDPGVIPVDGDNDGFTVCQGDCDDTDPLLSPLDGDGDGASSCAGDCDDGDPGMNLKDLDADGASTCQGDCNDYAAALNLQDVDQDGYTTCQGDCDDNLASMNLDDLDADGYTTCQGDCDDNDPILNPADADTDGVSSCDGDCDDNVALAHPGGTEVPYNGIDDDCLGGDLTDVDGDGYDATVVGGTDCDDNENRVNPGRTERCNGVDDNCILGVDEENATKCDDYYYDYDGDGYGTWSSRCTCNAGDIPYYTATNLDDCYDLNSDAHPGQTSYFFDDRGDGSWDYNCDNAESKIDTRTRDWSCNLCGFLLADCCYTTGWDGGAPACGESAQWNYGCDWVPVISCDPHSTSFDTINQECR